MEQLTNEERIHNLDVATVAYEDELIALKQRIQVVETILTKFKMMKV